MAGMCLVNLNESCPSVLCSDEALMLQPVPFTLTHHLVNPASHELISKKLTLATSNHLISNESIPAVSLFSQTIMNRCRLVKYYYWSVLEIMSSFSLNGAWVPRYLSQVALWWMLLSDSGGIHVRSRRGESPRQTLKVKNTEMLGVVAFIHPLCSQMTNAEKSNFSWEFGNS